MKTEHLASTAYELLLQGKSRTASQKLLTFIKKSNYSPISRKHIQVDDVIYILFLFLYYYRYIKRRFHLVMHLFSNRSQKISKSGKNISDKPTYRLMCILMSSVVNT